MTAFRKLAIASTVATFVLVAIGGLVRATKSGLGCGDNWPHCPGEVTRALVIEMSHRAAAGAVIVLLAALAVAAYRNRARHPHLVRPSIAAFGLVLFQAVLGAIVVWLELDAGSVVLHLTAAMALLALLVHISVAAVTAGGTRPAPADPPTARRAAIVAGAVLAVLLAGSYVTGREAGYVFGDWPLMDGRLVPDLAVQPYALHFLHRFLAGAVGVAVFVLAFGIMRRKTELPLQAKLAHVAAGAYAVEVGVGALNVWTRLNAASVTLHLALGALVWAALVAMAAVSRTSGERVTRRTEPAWEAV